MLSLKPQQSYAPPTKWQYRLSRFMLTRVYWALTRIILPMLLLIGIIYQIWTSQSVRNLAENTRAAIFQKVAYLPMFVVDDIRFTNATKLREEEVRAMLDFEPGMSILEIDRDEMLRNLSSLDAVGSVQIRYGYDGQMDIVLEPRIPALIFYNEGLFETIDASGHRVENLSDRSERAGLFVISGEGADLAAEEAVTLIEYLAPFAQRVRGLVRVGGRRWDIVLLNDARVMLPAENALEAVQVLLKQERTNHLLNRDFTVYDLRNLDRPILRLDPSLLTPAEGEAQ